MALLWVCAAYGQQTATSSNADAGKIPAAKTTSKSKKKTSSAATHSKTASTGARTSKSSGAKAYPASASAKGSTSNTGAVHNGKSKYVSSRKSSKRKKVARGQQKIDPERAQAIQEALIREHYLSSDAAGNWNQASEDAMRRYQADHGWQSKTVPDARALISLGLGPSHDHLLNPESAMTTEPAAPHAASLNPVSQSSAPQNAPSQSPVSHSAEPGTQVAPSPASNSDPDSPQ